MTSSFVFIPWFTTQVDSLTEECRNLKSDLEDAKAQITQLVRKANSYNNNNNSSYKAHNTAIASLCAGKEEC